MPNHLSLLGIIHTAFSIIALLAAFYALYRSGRIDPKTGPGRWYIILTVITCLTSLPIMKTGQFTSAHYVAVVILVVIPLGVYMRSLRIFGRLADYMEVIFLSSTLFLSSVPAIVETLTRLPISHPIAAGPNDPIIQNALAALALLYFVGVLYQLFRLGKQRKAGQQLKGVMN